MVERRKGSSKDEETKGRGVDGGGGRSRYRPPLSEDRSPLQVRRSWRAVLTQFGFWQVNVRTRGGSKGL